MKNTSEKINFISPIFVLNPTFCLKYNSFGLIFCLFTMALSFLVAIPANLWCIWSYHPFDWKNKQTVLFLLNHTIMDLLMSMQNSLEILNMFCIKSEALLLVTYYMFDLCWAGRPLIQTCISIEQYFAVIQPIKFLRYKNLNYRIAAVAVAWLSAFSYGIYANMAGDFPDPVLNTGLIIALAVNTFCGVSVLCALNRPGPGDTHITRQRRRGVGNQPKRNAFFKIISALIIVFLTYVPNIIYSMCSLVDIDEITLYCNILPFIGSFTLYSVILSPMLKIYKKQHLKCFNWENK